MVYHFPKLITVDSFSGDWQCRHQHIPPKIGLRKDSEEIILVVILHLLNTSLNENVCNLFFVMERYRIL